MWGKIIEKGWFDKTIPDWLSKTDDSPLALINIDSDLYSSCKLILELLKHRITKNTIILFDEFYNYDTYLEDEYKAFSEFVERYNFKYEFIKRGGKCCAAIRAL